MSDVSGVCNHHPNQLLVGVCPFCLNDKLLVIAAKQDRRNRRRRTEELSQPSHSRKPSNGGLLAFGSILSRLELRRSHRRSSHRGSCDFDGGCGGCSDSQSTSSSLEDSFISMKFEEDGVASWDKRNVSEACLHANGADPKGVEEEHTNTPQGSLRWRKRIGHLLQLVTGKGIKKPNEGVSHNSCVDGLGQGVKVMNME